MSTQLPPSDSANSEKTQFVIAEYNAMRAEIMKRSEFRYQLISLTLVIAGTILTFGLQPTSPSYVLFVFPVLAVFLVGVWAHNVIVPKRISAFIKENIESQFGGFGWESAIQKDLYSFAWLRGVISSSGIFLGTELITFLLGLLKTTFTPIDVVLIIADVISILLTLIVVRSTTLKPSVK